MLQDKLRAFSLHLAISLGIFAVLLYLIVYHWYPQPFFAYDGGWQGIRIIAAVDVVLGPLLTLIVYKRAKPGLKFDLGIIAALQIAALSWGIHTVYTQRPVLVDFTLSRFYTVTADQLPRTGLKPGALTRFTQTTPLPMAYTDIPDDLDKQTALLLESLRSGQPLYLRGDLYRPIDANSRRKIRARAIDVRAALPTTTPAWHTLQQFLIVRHARVDDYLYLPLSCRYAQLIAVVNPHNMHILKAIPLEKPQLQYRLLNGKSSAKRTHGPAVHRPAPPAADTAPATTPPKPAAPTSSVPRNTSVQ